MMSAEPDPLIGTIVSGRYQILKLLGKGGMGNVYLGEHVAIQKRIALKILRGEFSENSDVVSRFRQEAISASRIKHPNVLDVFDFGQLDDGCFFLAMEYLEGTDLGQELDRLGVIGPEHGIKIAYDVCRALAAAHAQGVVHRDLKPENVFLQRIGDGEEQVKIVDFGIAQLRSNRQSVPDDSDRRLTKAGTIFGTPEYMAPEQALGQDVDLRSDVYALGVILFEMFSGEVPFTGETFVEVLHKHLTLPPPLQRLANAGISPELNAAIERALEKEREDRFQSMAQFAAALRATSEGASVAAIAHGAPIPEVLQSQLKTVPPPPPDEPEPIPLSRPIGEPPPSSASGMHLSRRQTELGAITPARPSKSKSSWPISAVLLLLVAGGAATLYTRRGSAPPQSAPSQPPYPAAQNAAEPNNAPQNVPVTPSATAETPAPAASVIESLVRLDVQTTPTDATLFKNGFQVCDSTPCDVLVKPNETLVLEARKGPLQGSAKVLAQQDQHVSIPLGRLPSGSAAPKSRTPAAAPSASGGRMCEVEVDGLKILRPCP